MHFYGWKKGLKTGMYYLRTKAASQAIQFTVDKFTEKSLNSEIPKFDAEKEKAEKSNKSLNDFIGKKDPVSCSLDDPDCESCSA